MANLAVNGFTTADVIAVELPRLEALAPDFITLQIGVNDVVQGVPEATYRDRLGQILAALRTRLSAERIVLVTTPDYTVTPAGADYGDPATKRAAIRRFNDDPDPGRPAPWGSPSSTSSTSPRPCATDRASSHATGFIRPVASTACGWLGSRRRSGRSSAQPRRRPYAGQRWRWSSSSRASSMPKWWAIS